MEKPADTHWQWKGFSELTTMELYALLELRQQIFIVEQQCPYPDIDRRDEYCHHLLVWSGDASPGDLLAGLRIVPAGVYFAEIAIGRIVVSSAQRSKGLGGRLILEGIDYIRRELGPQPIRISAQYHLSEYYRRFGFRETGNAYDEDGIPHIDMLRGSA